MNTRPTVTLSSEAHNILISCENTGDKQGHFAPEECPPPCTSIHAINQWYAPSSDGVAVERVFTASGVRADDLATGKKLYTDNCQRCDSAKGQGGVGVKLTGDAAYWEFAAFKTAVLTGVDDAGKPLKKPMPLFEKVGLTVPKGEIPTDAERHDVQAYLVSRGPKK